MAGAFHVVAKIDDREVLAALNRLQRRASRMVPAWKNIGEALTQSTKQRFRDQVDPDERRWQRLRMSTRNSKRIRGLSPKILRARGYLADTIHYQADDNGVRVGTDRVYGAIHQFGGKTKAHVIKPRGKKALYWPGARRPVRGVHHPGSVIPARPYLGVSRQDRDRILEIVADYLAAIP